MRDSLDEYQTHSRAGYGSSEDHREARADAWPEFLGVLNEQQIELEQSRRLVSSRRLWLTPLEERPRKEPGDERLEMSR